MFPLLGRKTVHKLYMKFFMDNMSQKQSYAEKRRLYYEEVISQYTQGKTISEISMVVPLSRSTVHRWVGEYVELKSEELPDDVVIPRTPASVAKTIQAMAGRIRELENNLEAAESDRKKLKAIKHILFGDADPEQDKQI